MTNENFFKHDNKAYTENLNDAILIANAFDYQVPVNIPGMYGNNHYPNDNNIHKVGVADVTIVSSGSLSIGDTSITNNSNTSQVLRLRVYPNFNSFYAWKKLNWTCTGDVTVNICDTGTSTSLLPSGALTNPDNETLLNGISSLQGLKEYDLLITIPVSGVLNTLSLVFVNNWNSQNRVSASINQSNVTGLEEDLESVNSSLENLDERLDTVGNKVVDITYADNPHLDFTSNTQQTQTLGYAVVRNNFCQLYLQTLVSPNQTMQTDNTYTIIRLGNWDIASKQVRVSKIMHTRRGKRFFLDIIPTTMDTQGRVDIIPIEEISGGDYLYISETYLV